MKFWRLFLAISFGTSRGQALPEYREPRLLDSQFFTIKQVCDDANQKAQASGSLIRAILVIFKNHMCDISTRALSESFGPAVPPNGSARWVNFAMNSKIPFFIKVVPIAKLRGIRPKFLYTP